MDDIPFVVGEFIAHNSKLQLWTLNHGQCDAILAGHVAPTNATNSDGEPVELH
jgi:hypothetical protein